ncbi:MAG: hypothetical protein V3V84_08790 [Candidatus Bathyarchaeia archaeon]
MSYTAWYTEHEEDCIRAFLDLPDSLRDEVTVDDVASVMYEEQDQIALYL